MDNAPKFRSGKFQCPHCQVVSQQRWFDVQNASDIATNTIVDFFYEYRKTIKDYSQKAIEGFLSEAEPVIQRNMSALVPGNCSVATCSACGDISVWVQEEIVYPRQTVIPKPNQDMDQEIQDLYIEASAIVADSPRGATALLRLSLQLLLKQLGKPGKDINDDIKALVAKGLSPKIQQALDLLRVVGNNAVHPGQIDLNDGRDIAFRLFGILNFIADEMLTKPREIERLYSDVVPAETKRHISERDGE